MTGPAERPPEPVAKSGRRTGKAVFADLLPRVLSALVLVAVALGTVFEGGWSFDALWWLASVAIFWEWQGLVAKRVSRVPFLAGAVAITVAAAMLPAAGVGVSLGILVFGTLAVGLLAPAPVRTLAAVGVVYSGALVLSVSLLRASFPFGLAAILWLFAVVWGTDVMAYFGGRLIGGPKLSPRLSPSKTWSGFLIGVGCGALAGLLVAPAESPHGIVFGLGLLGGAVAQGGDILESALKRRAGVKDASRLIPGHGGVMDRLDGFLAAATFAALLGLARFGPAASASGLFQW